MRRRPQHMLDVPLDLPLTLRQAEILGFIAASAKKWGFPPSIREIGQRFAIASTNAVAEVLAQLQRKGHLVRKPGRARAMQVVNRGKR